MQTLRGVSADIIYCEEMAYMDLAVVYQVVVPLIEMEHAVLIGISTPVDNYNFFQRLLHLKDPQTNLPVVNSYVVELVCGLCKQKTTGGENCMHMISEVPSWKSTEKYEIVKLIFGEENLKDLMRESRGVATDQSGLVIDSADLAALSKSTWKCDMLNTPRYIVTFCDPNAGGANHMAFCSLAFVDGCIIVCTLFFSSRSVKKNAFVRRLGKYFFLKKFIGI